jgi:hypothetical protein
MKEVEILKSDKILVGLDKGRHKKYFWMGKVKINTPYMVSKIVRHRITNSAC